MAGQKSKEGIASTDLVAVDDSDTVDLCVSDCYSILKKPSSGCTYRVSLSDMVATDD